MRHLSSCLLLLLALGIGAETTPPIAPETQLAQVLSNVDTLYARYEQRSNAPEVQTGEIWLSKPDRFRVVSGPPLSQTVVSNSETLWTYDQDLEQVIITRFDSQAAEIPILLFTGDPADIAERYDVEFFADETRQHFLLSPKDDSSLLSALAMSFENTMPVSIVVETSTQQRTTIRLFDQVLPAELNDDQFEFQVPEGVDVIDDRPGT